LGSHREFRNLCRGGGAGKNGATVRDVHGGKGRELNKYCRIRGGQFPGKRGARGHVKERRGKTGPPGGRTPMLKNANSTLKEKKTEWRGPSCGWREQITYTWVRVERGESNLKNNQGKKN